MLRITHSGFFCSILVFFLMSPAFADYSITYESAKKFQLITFYGEIMPGNSSQEIKQVIDQIQGERDLVLQVNSSLGGWVPSYLKLISGFRNRCTELRGSECKVTVVFTGTCSSACTFLPLLADRAVALPDAQFRFHREWILFKSFKLSSKKGLGNRYIRLGANADWFDVHTEVLNSDQTYGYAMPKSDEIPSGIVDEQISSWESFVAHY